MRIRVVDAAPLPVNSILASLCICVIIALLNLGGRKIFNSIVGLLTGTLGLTYALSIGCVLWRRCYGEPLPTARWSLGRWGIPLNIIALLYMLTSSIISFFPIFNGTTVANMNWWVPIYSLDEIKLTELLQFTGPAPSSLSSSFLASCTTSSKEGRSTVVLPILSGRRSKRQLSLNGKTAYRGRLERSQALNTFLSFPRPSLEIF